MTNILITGANGFVVARLYELVPKASCSVRRALRIADNQEGIVVGEAGPDTVWISALEDIDVVVHLAALVHIINDKTKGPMTEFRRVNVQGTANLARQAVQAGVRRFVFVSSIKVNGEGRSTPYSEEDLEKPQDDYSMSKWEAEKILSKIAEETGMEIVILKSPLVYGPRAKANFLRLLKLIERGIPLPLASVNNLA
jgi:UDP-glucose 4-epimerase